MESSLAFAYTELDFWRLCLSWETTINYCDECCRRIYKTRKYIRFETYRIFIGAHIYYKYYYPAGCSSFSYFFSLSFSILFRQVIIIVYFFYYHFGVLAKRKRRTSKSWQLTHTCVSTQINNNNRNETADINFRCGRIESVFSSMGLSMFIKMGEKS